MWTTDPDHIILLGGRTLTSLAGILSLVVGTWQTGRYAVEEEEDEGLPKGPDEVIQARNSQKKDNDSEVVEDYAAMHETSAAMLFQPATVLRALGWGLLAFSQLLTPYKFIGWSLGTWKIASCILFVVMGFADSMEEKHSFLQIVIEEGTTQDVPIRLALLGLGWVAQGAILSVAHDIPAECILPFWAFCIAVAVVILWYAKKESTVMNLGGPLLVWGLAWFWMGSNVVVGAPDKWYLPLYLNGARTHLAFFGAAFGLLVLWSTKYALDEAPPNLRQNVGFGIAHYFFGAVWEIKIAMVLAWSLMGIAAFLPYLVTWYWPTITFLVIVTNGVAMSMLYEGALRSGHVASMKYWVRIQLGLLVFLSILLAAQTWVAMIVGLVAASCMVFGQYLLHHHCKRGHLWMETGQENKRPVVFSYGVLLTPLGFFLLAYAISLR
jgi:hypothetical protein